LLERFYGFLLN